MPQPDLMLVIGVAGSGVEHTVAHGASSAPLSPTGGQWRLTRGEQSAVVIQLGGALRDYEVNGRPVLDGFPAGSALTGGRGRLLVPWPNREPGATHVLRWGLSPWGGP
ncbi:hypothetical protein ACWGIN_32445 [Streptomyces sp. NPDC054861]